jgi:hypothetical protein
MAQTKRKRQTKHRGNAAGVIESRGRTGRKPTAAEKSGDKEKLAREKEALIDKRDRPPTWRSAFTKAMFFGVVFLLVFIVVLNQGGSAIGLFPFVIAFYTVVGYYTDKWMFDRRQRSKAKKGTGKKAASR